MRQAWPTAEDRFYSDKESAAVWDRRDMYALYVRTGTSPNGKWLLSFGAKEVHPQIDTAHELQARYRRLAEYTEGLLGKTGVTIVAK